MNSLGTCNVKGSTLTCTSKSLELLKKTFTTNTKQKLSHVLRLTCYRSSCQSWRIWCFRRRNPKRSWAIGSRLQHGSCTSSKLAFSWHVETWYHYQKSCWIDYKHSNSKIILINRKPTWIGGFSDALFSKNLFEVCVCNPNHGWNAVPVFFG